MMKQALSLAFASTLAQLCTDCANDGNEYGIYTNYCDAMWLWIIAMCLRGRSDPEVQERQKSLLVSFMEQPALPIKFRVEKVLWQILVLGIDQGKCVLPILI